MGCHDDIVTQIMIRHCCNRQEGQHESRYGLFGVQPCRGRSIGIGKTLRYYLDKRCQLAVDYGTEDVVLVAEMIVDEALTNAGLRRDIAQPRALIPMPGEKNFGGIENSLPGFGSFGGIACRHIEPA